MTRPPVEHGALRAVVAHLLDAPCGPLRVAKMGRSPSVTYEAEVMQTAVVIKTNSDADVLAGTAHNLQVLAGLKIPAPRVLAYERWSEEAGVGVLVMERLRGRDLHFELESMDRSQMTALAEQIIDIQRRVASLPAGEGCGYVSIGETATRPWSDVVRRPNRYALAEPVPSDAAPLVRRLATTIDAAEWYLASVAPTCFLDDLTTKNVLITEGRLSGVVDFDVVCYGDPVFHLGLTAAAVTANTSPSCRFYVDELVRISNVSGAQRHAVDLYEAVFLVNFLANEQPHKPGDWRTAASTVAAARLSTAGSFFTSGEEGRDLG